MYTSASDMSGEVRWSWATGKVLSYLYADETAGRLKHGEQEQLRAALMEGPLGPHGDRCSLRFNELVWAVYSEHQAILYHLECA